MISYYEKDGKIYIQCTKCGEYKEKSNFSKHIGCKFGVRKICRVCDNLNSQKYRGEHRQHYIELTRKYHEEHREQEREYNREYRKAHKEICLAQLKRYPHKRKARWTTYNFIKYNGIEKPKQCSICLKESKVEIHHPNYDERNNVVFCCRRCHALIHRGDKVEYKPIDLLKTIKTGEN